MEAAIIVNIGFGKLLVVPRLIRQTA
jgi:hypothetical protein